LPAANGKVWDKQATRFWGSLGNAAWMNAEGVAWLKVASWTEIAER